MKFVGGSNCYSTQMLDNGLDGAWWWAFMSNQMGVEHDGQIVLVDFSYEKIYILSSHLFQLLIGTSSDLLECLSYSLFVACFPSNTQNSYSGDVSSLSRNVTPIPIQQNLGVFVGGILNKGGPEWEGVAGKVFLGNLTEPYETLGKMFGTKLEMYQFFPGRKYPNHKSWQGKTHGFEAKYTKTWPENRGDPKWWFRMRESPPNPLNSGWPVLSWQLGRGSAGRKQDVWPLNSGLGIILLVICSGVYENWHVGDSNVSFQQFYYKRNCQPQPHTIHVYQM